MKNTWGGKASYALACSMLLVVLYACNKSEQNSNGSESFALYLTDDPARFDALNIDLQYVEIKVDTLAGRREDDDAGRSDDDDDDNGRRHDENGRWDTLDFQPGLYNVAALRNGLETRLATGTINGRVRKVRLTLGTGSTVVVDGVTYPLQLLPGSSKYVYVKLEDKHRSYESGQQRVWLDFDISRSVVLRNGQYYLKPRIKPFCDDQFGSLTGKVFPAAAEVQVTVYSAQDTASAYPESDGRFKIRGLIPGTYTVVYDGIAPYKDTTVTNVAVTKGKAVQLASVTLKQ